MSSTTSNTEAIKNQVREALRSQKIKLWEPPYVNDQGEPNLSALEQLASSWSSNHIVVVHGVEGVVVSMLQEWQTHALNKLAAKQQQPPQSPISATSTSLNLQIKILGEELDNEKHDLLLKESKEWANDVQVETKSGSITVLSLQGVSTTKSDTELMEFFHKIFPDTSSAARWIHRGKNLTLNQNKTLQTLFPPETNNTTVSLLCLLSERLDPDESQRTQAHATTTIHDRIEAIRTAARQIRDTTKLDITDQHGKIVPMSGEDRLGFLTALALHRLGLNTTSLQDALVLLLEADVEWNQHPNLNTMWKDKVDNYGLLQLDISWIYLQWESLSNLPDSLKRLQEAERVLSKQVHKNFVPLALTQAELGNAHEVPPLAAVFAKLFLLQGIAYLCDSSNESRNSPSCSASKSKEKLDQAFVLLQSLRSMAPEESVRQLLDVMGGRQQQQYTASDAIAALRKAHGNLDAAVVALGDQESERQRLRRDREAQHQYGLCQNEKDPVDLEKLETLKPLLKGGRQDDASTSSWALETANTELAVGLLRLANNDLNRAMELYAEQDYQPQNVYSMVDSLDQKLVQCGLLGRRLLGEKRKKRKLYEEASQPAVDEMALVTLVSMGVDESNAKKALSKSENDVERAMLWLSSANDEEEDNSDRTPTLAESDQNETAGAKVATRQESEAVVRMRELEREAQELLHRELGDILEERDLEKEYLGKDLEEEWQLLLKYRRSG